MPNDYYNAPTSKNPLEIIRSTEYNTNNQANEAAFDKLPSEEVLKRTQYGTDISTLPTLYKVEVPSINLGYYESFTVVFEALFSNTGPANIQINSEAIVELVDAGGNPLAVGDIASGQLVTAIYTSNLVFQVQFSADAKFAAAEAAASAASAASALSEIQLIVAFQDEIALHFYRNT